MNTLLIEPLDTQVLRCNHGMEKDWCSLCNPRLDQNSMSISSFEALHTIVEVAELAKEYLQLIPQETHASILLRLVTNEISAARRNRVRSIEERSEVGRKREERDQKKHNEKELYFDRPWEAPASSFVGKQWRVHSPVRRNSTRAQADPAFATYLDTFPKKSVEVSEMAFASWKVNRAFDQLVNSVRTETVLELTRELLSSQFSLGDGKSVLWGEATVDDHLNRIHLLLAQATGNVETSNRHKAAIYILQKHGVTKLNDVTATPENVVAV